MPEPLRPRRSSQHRSGERRSLQRRSTGLASLAAAGLATGGLFAATLAVGPTRAAAASAVPCATSGGVHSCAFTFAGDGTSVGTPVVDDQDALVGYLSQGKHEVGCQASGRHRATESGASTWWAWVTAGNGTAGWASAVFVKGGDDGGTLADVPACGSTHGTPPRDDVPKTTCASRPSSDGSLVTRWNPVVRCVLKMLGKPTSSTLVRDTDIIISHESSGNPDAVAGWDSNARRGTPSIGLMQTIQPTFDGNNSTHLVDNVFDPAANIYAGLHYGIGRYGSIAQIPGVKSVNDGGPYKPYRAR